MMLFCERLKSREACKHLKVLNNTIYNHVGKLESNFILNCTSNILANKPSTTGHVTELW